MNKIYVFVDLLDPCLRRDDVDECRGDVEECRDDVQDQDFRNYESRTIVQSV